MMSGRTPSALAEELLGEQHETEGGQRDAGEAFGAPADPLAEPAPEPQPELRDEEGPGQAEGRTRSAWRPPAEVMGGARALARAQVAGPGRRRITAGRRPAIDEVRKIESAFSSRVSSIGS
jgi:hypothetical protein